MPKDVKKDLIEEKTPETEDVNELMLERKGKEIGYYVDKGESEELGRMHMEEEKDLTEETMQETEDVPMVKRKGKEIEYFGDKGEGEDPKRMHMKAKEDVTKKTMQKTEDVKETMVKRKGMEVEFFVDKGNGEEPKRMHMEAKEDLTKETMQETDYDKEAMIKRKGMEVGFFVDKGDGEKPKRMHTEAKEDLTKETMQTDYDREAMIKRKGMEVEFFVAKGEGEEPKRMHMEAKEDLTEETMQEAEDDKEEMVKRKGMEVGFFIDKGEGEGEEPKRMHMEAKEDLTKETVQDTEDVKEAIVKRNGKGIDYFVDKGGGEELKRMHMEAKEDMTRETMQEEIKNGIKDSDQQNIWEKTVKGRFGKPKNITEELPKQVQEHDGSKGFKVSKREEQKEVIKEAMFETESLTEKVEGEESKKRTERTSRVIEKSTETETSKETEEFNIERNARDGPYIPDNMVKGVFDVSGTVQAKFPKHVVDAIAQDMKDKNKYVTVKFKGEGSINMHVEPNEAYDEDTTLNRIQEEIRKPKLKPGDQISGKENVDIEALDESKRTKFPEMRETDVKKEGAKIEESVKKENGDKYEKIQVEAKGGIRKDITKESTWKEREGPKILTKEKDQQLLQEMSTARVEASKAAKKEFRAKMVDSLDEAEEVKEELVKQKSEEKKTKDVKEGAEIEQFVKKVKGKAGKRKSEETKAVETATKEKMQEPESERIVQTLQEPEDKHPKVLKTGTPERESQYEKGSTTQEKVVSRGFKEVEQKRAKEKTQMLPPKIQSKETHESKIESENQDILKPKKEKEVKGKQTENTKKIATMEDQVAKPLSAPSFPSTPQSEVEAKDKLYRGGKEKYKAFLESQREDPTKDMKNLIDMRETQESKQTETLKPEIPLEEHLKRGAQVNKKDKFHKGQESGETMQEETEGLKDIYDDRDQQFMQRDVGKGVEKVDTSGKEMLKREYVADAGSIAERMETKRDMEATPERDKYITDQKVKDEKARIQEENINVDFEKEDKAKYTVESFETTQEKEHPMKLGVEKEAESLEAISSLPSVISMGVEGARLTKNEIEEIQEEELSTLTAEMKSEDPLELEKPITEWKVPKTKSYVAEPRGREQYGYGKEDIKEPKISAYQGAKPSKFQTITPSEQSLDEEDRRSENVVEAQETSKGFEEKEKVDGKKINQEETKGSKISIQDRNQQPMQENNDKKGYETRKVIEEEMLKPKHRAEVVLEKREGPKVTKSEETKEASRQQLKREREKPTQTEEDKKPKMKEITPEFKKASGFKQIAEKMPKTREKDHKIELEEVTPKMMVKSPTTIEITPKKGIEKSKEEKSPKPMAFPRKEPHELSWSSKDYKIPKIEDVQQEKERERPIHTLGTTAPEEEEIAQAKAMHLKSKSDDELKDETGKPHVNQLPLPSKEMLSKESCEFDKLSVKEDDSKVEDSVQMQERKELISSTEDTTASEVISDEVAEPSKLSSSSKDKKDASHDVGKQESQDSEDSKIDGQESTKGKTDQEVEKRETLQPESPADHEESHEIQEFEEEKAYEQGDEACEYSQELEEQKESKEEGTGGKKDNTKRSKKLFVSLIIAGSALLASGIFIFIRHRRARKSVK